MAARRPAPARLPLPLTGQVISAPPRASVAEVLIRGLLAGLLAGLVAFAVAYLVGEPAVDTAIGLEAASGHEGSSGHESSSGHEGGAEPEVVSRTLQSTAGLLTGTVVAGVTLGGLVAVVSALALGRFGRLGVRGTVLAVVAAGFVAGYLVPFLVQPPNPPGVGHGDTIGTRTAVYFAALAVSLVAGSVAVAVGRRLARRWGGWYAGLATGAGYLAAVLVAAALLPRFHEVPDGYPAELLYAFRTASLLVQAALWGSLGLILAELLHRLTTRPARPAAAREPVVHP